MSERVSIGFAGGVADVRLTRPDKMNALDPAMFDAITAAIDELETMAGLHMQGLRWSSRSSRVKFDELELLPTEPEHPVLATVDQR